MSKPIFLLILIVLLIRQGVFSLFNPMFQAPDETQHLVMVSQMDKNGFGIYHDPPSVTWFSFERSYDYVDDYYSQKGIFCYTEVSVPRGGSLKRAEVAKGLLDCDVLINVPIAKDHTGVRFTGTMKNMMGATSSGTNSFFHSGSGARGYYDDVEFLSQCIADVNLVRKPDLCIVDGTEVLTTNGPQGPGKLTKPQKIFAGVDRVAMDVYGANLLGLKGEEIRTTRMAHEHGLGEIHLSRLRIQEVTL
jgi:hypothetical protein